MTAAFAGEELLYRTGYAADPAGRAAVADLLHQIFDIDLAPLDRLGGWDPSYRPFSYFDKAGRCIANVALLALPLVLRGERVEAVGIQSVAVRPEWRGRGLFRDLMERALAWCAERAPLVLLLTEIPALYEPYGFRAVAEHSFVGPASPSRRGASARLLSLEAAEDLRLLRRLLLAKRTPVSQRFGLLGHASTFLLNVAWNPRIQLHYLPNHDAVAATEVGETSSLRLLDVVGSTIPPLADILGALDSPAREVEVCFAPDRLDWKGRARLLTDGISLMVRGPFLGPDEPAMLPPTAAF